MTARDGVRRARAEGRDADRAYATEAGPSLPERLAAARERKGVDLYRAERDTKTPWRRIGRGRSDGW